MTLSELKKLAQSATKGFWFFNRKHGLHVLLIPTAEPHHIASEVKIADGKYIQAMQPQTALRMIELLADAEDYMQDVPCQCNGSTAWNQLPVGHVCRRCEWIKSLESFK